MNTAEDIRILFLEKVIANLLKQVNTAYFASARRGLHLVEPLKEMNNIASAHPEVCKKLRERLWDEASGDLPLYDVIRHGHEWYEYPDIHDPTGTFSESLIEKRDARKRKD